jgi:hypothetical protein
MLISLTFISESRTIHLRGVARKLYNGFHFTFHRFQDIQHSTHVVLQAIQALNICLRVEKGKDVRHRLIKNI